MCATDYRGHGHRIAAPVRELREGESVVGIVRQLPEPGALMGRHVILQTEDGLFAYPCHERNGHKTLGTQLRNRNVQVWQRVQVTLYGWRYTSDQQRRYRAYGLTVLPRRREW